MGRGETGLQTVAVRYAHADWTYNGLPPQPWFPPGLIGDIAYFIMRAAPDPGPIVGSGVSGFLPPNCIPPPD